MKLTTNFWLEEFVSKAIYKKWGDASIWFIDPRLPLLFQFIRDRHGSVTVNNWKWGGDRNYSGFREPTCKVGAKLSQHRFGRAGDGLVNNLDEVWEDIEKNFDLYKKYGLTTIEKNVTWLHGDMRWTGSDELKIVYP